MSERDAAATLRQMIDFADEIAGLVESRSRAELEANREFFRALERCVELLGEAATRLTDEFRTARPEVPWRQIIGMRNVMIHGYDIISLDVLWDTASRDVPELRKKIETIVRTLP